MSNESRAKTAPTEGYHWAYTERCEKRHRRAEIVYVHHRSDGEVQIYPFDRTLPLSADELHSWGPPVPPGPTTGTLAQIERFAPVRRLDGDTTSPISIPNALHMRAHASWSANLNTPRTADDVARCGGFTPAELDEHAPGWRECTSVQTPPILFLDIDGVLNVVGGKTRKERHEGIAKAVAQLRRVVSTTGCSIVLSSAWRLFNEPFKAIRERLGYTGPFIGRTPDLKGQPRGLEIAAWLADQPHAPACWAVVDDTDHGEMEFVRHRFVHTNPYIGIGETEADRLIELLTNPDAGLLESAEGAAQ